MMLCNEQLTVAQLTAHADSCDVPSCQLVSLLPDALEQLFICCHHQCVMFAPKRVGIMKFDKSCACFNHHNKTVGERNANLLALPWHLVFVNWFLLGCPSTLSIQMHQLLFVVNSCNQLFFLSKQKICCLFENDWILGPFNIGKDVARK